VTCQDFPVASLPSLFPVSCAILASAVADDDSSAAVPPVVAEQAYSPVHSCPCLWRHPADPDASHLHPSAFEQPNGSMVAAAIERVEPEGYLLVAAVSCSQETLGCPAD
jgi:hypothetical protein